MTNTATCSPLNMRRLCADLLQANSTISILRSNADVIASKIANCRKLINSALSFVLNRNANSSSCARPIPNIRINRKRDIDRQQHKGMFVQSSYAIRRKGLCTDATIAIVSGQRRWSVSPRIASVLSITPRPSRGESERESGRVECTSRKTVPNMRRLPNTFLT